jgi:nucleoside-diphosphate kinase
MTSSVFFDIFSEHKQSLPLPNMAFGRSFLQKPFFNLLIDFITSGPSVSMVVEGKNAVAVMRAINGTTNPVNAATGSIRGDFALDTGRNIVHASDSVESAKREISIHFKDSEIAGYSRVDEAWVYE